jgi:hypothetical protein
MLSLATVVILVGLSYLTARTFTKPAQPGQPIEVDLADMANFDLDQKTGTLADIPQRLRDLDGRRVTFVCEMWQPVAISDGSDALQHFMAVPSRHISSFKPPVAQEFTDCSIPAGRAIHYDDDGSVCVTGMMHVSILKDKASGYTKSIYHTDVESVEPLHKDNP